MQFKVWIKQNKLGFLFSKVFKRIMANNTLLNYSKLLCYCDQPFPPCKTNGWGGGGLLFVKNMQLSLR